MPSARWPGWRDALTPTPRADVDREPEAPRTCRNGELKQSRSKAGQAGRLAGKRINASSAAIVKRAGITAPSATHLFMMVSERDSSERCKGSAPCAWTHLSGDLLGDKPEEEAAFMPPLTHAAVAG